MRTSGLGEVYVLDIESHQQYYNIVGNILGKTGTTWTLSLNYPADTTGTWNTPIIYHFGYQSPGTLGTGNTDSLTTATMVGNYNYSTSSIPAGETLSGATLPNSLYLSSPASPPPGIVWGSLAWPPFDPTGTPSPAVTQIPAGYRYTKGVDPNTAVVRSALYAGKYVVVPA